MSETTVGGLVGYLRMDADQFHREIAVALAEADKLNAKRVDIEVKADGVAKTATELGALSAEADAASGSTERLGKNSQASSQGVGAMATAVLTLGPALIPIAAGAAAAGAGLAGMGAAGVVAILGIRDEMKAGTDVGLAYTAGIASLQGQLQRLGAVGAGQLLGPFQQTVTYLQSQMPALSGELGTLTGMVGNTASALAQGLIAGLVTLGPLMADVGTYVTQLSQQFAGMMQGPGVASFADYLRSVFPQVVSTVESLVEAALRLGAAFAPLGGGTLSILGVLANLINAIPVNVLSTVATVAGSVFLAFRAWQGLDAVIGGVAGAMGRLGVEADAAAGAVRGLQAAAGIIGVAIAALSMIFAANAESTRQSQQATDDLADALRRTNGVIDESVRQTAFKALQDKGAIDNAKELGLNLGLVTEAALGNADALAQVRAVTGGVIANDRTHFTAAHDLQSALSDGNTELQAAVQKNKDLQQATSSTAGLTSGASLAQQAFAGRLGTTSTALQTAEAAQTKNADAAAQSTLKMQLENNAAGLLKGALDALSGKALSAAQAQQGFDQATLAVTQSTLNAKGAIDKSKTSIEGQSASAVANRGALLQNVTAAGQLAQATATQTGSSEAGRQKFIALRSAIIDNAVATGMNRDKVTAFIDEVMKVPASVPPTKVDVNRGILADATARVQAFKATIASLQDRTVNVTSVNRAVTVIDSGAYAGKQVGTNAEGSVTLGSGVRAMADGGNLRDGAIMRMTKPILWNEAPGGEAYIPLASSKRARSSELLAQTNQILGNPLGVGRQQAGPMHISGTLDLGDGLSGYVNGVLVSADATASRRALAGVN